MPRLIIIRRIFSLWGWVHCITASENRDLGRAYADIELLTNKALIRLQPQIKNISLKYCTPCFGSLFRAGGNVGHCLKCRVMETIACGNLRNEAPGTPFLRRNLRTSSPHQISTLHFLEVKRICRCVPRYCEVNVSRTSDLKPSGHYIYHLLEYTKTLYSAHTCICVFHTILTVNNDCFPKQHEPVGLCSGDIVCFLWRGGVEYFHHNPCES
jgi:hypothetical protein